jgi:hypothetical protein
VGQINSPGAFAALGLGACVLLIVVELLLFRRGGYI